MNSKLALALAMGLTLAACGDEDDAANNNSTNSATNSGTNNHTNNEEHAHAVTLSFAGLVNGDAFSCGQTYNLGSAQTPSEFSEFKMYVSEVELLTANGTGVPVELNDDGKWQNGSVALVDFEDGTGSCANGNADINTVVKGMVEHGEYTGVRFVLGVPFDNNHGDAATAESPLNVTTMFWSWQSGYKFLRVDGKADNGGFRVHLGSTGCMMGANDTVESCTNGNRPVIEFTDFDVESDVVNVDIGKLFEALDMTPDVDGNSAVCMSTPDHAACNQVFPELGLPFGTTAAAAQAVFSKK